MATIDKRNIDSKNRIFLPDFITIFTPSRVEEGEGVSELGKIEMDSHKHDLDDGSIGEYERKTIELSKYVATGVLSLEEAANLETLVRRVVSAFDFVEENYTEPATEKTE